MSDPSLEQKIHDLEQFKKAFDVQSELMKTFITTLQCASGLLFLRAMLRKTLELVVKLTDSPSSSLFWLDSNGIVTESILARGIIVKDDKLSVIGQVLEQGLAGWVYRNRTIGVIENTETDERWFQFADQPYEVKSVLCVPLIRGRSFLGIITLMHPEVGYFNENTAQLMEVVSSQISLVLDQVRFYLEYLHPQQKTQGDSYPPQSQQENVSLQLLAQQGQYIVTNEGKFIYADPQFAGIFGYVLADLVALESFFDLVSSDHLDMVKERFKACLQGQLDQFFLTFRGRCKDSRIIKIDLTGRRTKLYGKFLIIGAIRH